MDSRKFLALLLAVAPFYVQSLVIEKQLSSCAVVTDQGTVDFSNLAGTGGIPRFREINSVASPTATYDWNPCADFTEAQTCQNVAICRVDTACVGKRKRSDQSRMPRRLFDTCYQGLGSQSSSTFAINQFGLLELQVTDPNTQITAHIAIVCNNTIDSVQCTDDSTDPSNPIFQLSGPSVCFQQSGGGGGGGISIGTVLCIILLVVVATYIVGGVLYMKFRVRAQGAELMPNVSFWKSIPVHVKVGVLYVKSGFRPQSLSYENI